MRTMKRLAVSALCCGLLTAASARAYDLVKVISGSEIQVNNNGRPMSLILSGITVPAPPVPGSAGEYRGAEARDFLITVLKAQPAFIKEIEPVRPDATTVRVRIRVGPEGERDLAVLMAEAGLALVDKPLHEDPEFLAAVRDAERQARVAHRGMHDGGFTAFMNNQGHEIDFGVGTLSGDKPRYSAYLDNLARGSSSSSSTQGHLHAHAEDAIRDWGSRMGLPPDSSSYGH